MFLSTVNHGRIILVLLFLTFVAEAQTVVIGKVTDATTGDPVAFANVFFRNTSIGTTTDFNGLYQLQVSIPVDSIVVSYIGYNDFTKPVITGIEQQIDFQLGEQVLNLREVVFIAGENPAFEILQRIVDNKKKNDKRSLSAYQYESYNKIEIDMDNISETMREKRVMRKITQVLDSIEQIAGEDGKPILPLFISESITQYYFRNNPELKHEKVIKTRMSGVGIEDGTLVSQFVGSSFQEYNFYENWLSLVDKEFISPIADSWKMYYEYDLTDSGMVDGHYCYRLDFFPKKSQDLAFNGTMWITRDGYALRRIDVMVSPSANLNYIEKIKIQQELAPTNAGSWIPEQTRVLIDIGELTKNMAGILAKYYSSNKKIVVNKPMDEKFYEIPIEVADDFNENNGEEYWQENRHEPLSSTEQNVYLMIDTLKSLPVIRTYTDLMKILVGGYKTAGPLDIGPYLSIYSNNSVEGHRFQLGARTNLDFSKRWIIGGYLGYGTEDAKFKYNGFVEYLPDKKNWTSIQLEYTKDIDQVGLAVDNLAENYIFLTATRFGDLRRPYAYERYKFKAQRDLFKGYRQSISIRKESFEPLFPFAYITNQESPLATNYDFTEIVLESRYARDEVLVVNDNQRLSLGTLKWPVITFRLTAGINGLMGSDFDYQKVRLNVTDYLNMGFFGTSTVSVTGEYIFGALPFPMLEAHVGNESIFYTSAAFNMMNYSEFISDKYVSVKYNHHFHGFILNRIPLMKKLKWRLLATGNVLYGDLSQKNRDLIPTFTEGGTPIEQSFSMGSQPYVEVGYGIENIFKIGRVDFLHRLTHLDNPDVDKFGVKISLQFIL